MTIKFEFEGARDMADPKEMAYIAADLWDAGAYLCRKMDGEKRPIGKWKERRDTRENIIAWVEQGNEIGIVNPAKDLGISCVDIDNGLDYINIATEALGEKPIVVHESSRSKHGKCHAWYKTDTPTNENQWEGGDLRSGSFHFIVLYNLDAVHHAWTESQNNPDVKSVDLGKLPGIKLKSSVFEDNEDLQIGLDSNGVPIPEDVKRADSLIVDTARHETMISKIARAVSQCTTKSDLNERFLLITDSHKAALANETDKLRKANIRNEIATARVFMEGAWAKKKCMDRNKATAGVIIKNAVSKEDAMPQIEELIVEYEKDCKENGWPTPERCREEVISLFKYLWAKKEGNVLQKQLQQEARDKLDNEANALAAETFKSNGTGEFIVKAQWGTIESWHQAVEKIGINFRFNTFVDRGYVWIPEQIHAKSNGGGQWIEIDDINKSVITKAVELHAKAYPPGADEAKGVYLTKHKESQARDSLFAENSFCPMRNYFQSLPKWCGVPLIHKSMERGGMEIDAGEFTDSVQSFVWLFVVRNCLLPGSSMREYIVLHGPPDCGKSKFVELALPKHLKEYYNGSFSLEGSLKQKLERSLGKALMECGEMGQGGKKDWDAVKQWLTLSEINGERMAYKEFVKRHKLTATTVFTTNVAELPPTDEAAMSRFIWANVKSRATRKYCEKTKKTLNLVWSHFDELYDPKRPELGTWREQYFAEAFHRVKNSTKRHDWMDNGDKMTDWECNLDWLPENYLKRLIAWNKQAGASYVTDQSLLIDEIIEAIEMLDNHFGTNVYDGDCWYPNQEIKSAVLCVREGLDFVSWWDVVGVNGVTSERRTDQIRKAVADRQLGNAMKHAAERMKLRAESAPKRYKNAGNKSIRGWYFKLNGDFTE